MEHVIQGLTDHLILPLDAVHEVLYHGAILAESYHISDCPVAVKQRLRIYCHAAAGQIYQLD